MNLHDTYKAEDMQQERHVDVVYKPKRLALPYATARNKAIKQWNKYIDDTFQIYKNYVMTIDAFICKFFPERKASEDERVKLKKMHAQMNKMEKELECYGRMSKQISMGCVDFCYHSDVNENLHCAIHFRDGVIFDNGQLIKLEQRETDS